MWFIDCSYTLCTLYHINPCSGPHSRNKANTLCANFSLVQLLSHSLTLHTHTHTFTLSYPHTHTHHTFTLSYPHTHTSHLHTLISSHTRAHTLTPSHLHTLISSHTHPHTVVYQEAKCVELSQELAKGKEEVSSLNIKVKWAQNKLKTETEAHKVQTASWKNCHCSEL